MQKPVNNQKPAIGAALIGAAAGAAALVMAHKPTRKRVKRALQDAIDQGDRKLDELDEKATEAKVRAVNKVDEIREKARDKTAAKLAKTKRMLDETRNYA